MLSLILMPRLKRLDQSTPFVVSNLLLQSVQHVIAVIVIMTHVQQWVRNVTVVAERTTFPAHNSVLRMEGSVASAEK
jgi:hypothetical protein